MHSLNQINMALTEIADISATIIFPFLLGMQIFKVWSVHSNRSAMFLPSTNLI